MHFGDQEANICTGFRSHHSTHAVPGEGKWFSMSHLAHLGLFGRYLVGLRRLLLKYLQRV